MSRRERIGSAQLSDDLGEVGLEEIGDVDIIRACGMVSVRHPLGTRLWRLKYSGDHTELGAVVRELTQMLMRKGLPVDNPLQLVVRVVKHWLDDVCPSCLGRGYDVLPGTPMLSDVMCKTCEGEGRLKLPVNDEAARWVAETIARMEREVASAIMRKLNADLDL